MTNDDDVLNHGALDVADERVDIVGDSHLSQVSRLAPTTRNTRWRRNKQAAARAEFTAKAKR
jgi:hypothetical protein